MTDSVNDVSISFTLFFQDIPTGGVWHGAPKELRELLQNDDSFLRGITDRLDQDKYYEVTISFLRQDQWPT